MLVPLMVLAVLSIAGGWIGVPGSLGGNNRFDKFLGPVFRSTAPAVTIDHASSGNLAPPEQQTEGPEPKSGHGTEFAFTGISVMAALMGWTGNGPRGKVSIDADTRDIVQDEHALEVVRLPDGKLGHKVLGSVAQVKDECKALKIGRCGQ